MNLDLFERQHTHSGGLSTETLAARKASMSVLSLRARILADLIIYPNGLTPDDWASNNKALINTVRRRFTDLWKDGLIRHHPESRTKKNAAGNDCVVWVQGRDPLLAAERVCSCCGQRIKRKAGQ